MSAKLCQSRSVTLVTHHYRGVGAGSLPAPLHHRHCRRQHVIVLFLPLPRPAAAATLQPLPADLPGCQTAAGIGCRWRASAPDRCDSSGSEALSSPTCTRTVPGLASTVRAALPSPPRLCKLAFFTLKVLPSSNCTLYSLHDSTAGRGAGGWGGQARDPSVEGHECMWA